VTVSIRPSDVAAVHDIEVWIDTGFNGDLVLPRQQISDLELPPSGTLKAVLADGSEIALQRYACLIEWFGAERELEVVANDGVYPLLGVGLLAGYDLHISYRSGKITIE
jgi:clan AA aspartic protease